MQIHGYSQCKSQRHTTLPKDRIRERNKKSQNVVNYKDSLPFFAHFPILHDGGAAGQPVTNTPSGRTHEDPLTITPNTQEEWASSKQKLLFPLVTNSLVLLHSAVCVPSPGTGISEQIFINFNFLCDNHHVVNFPKTIVKGKKTGLNARPDNISQPKQKKIPSMDLIIS